ncbi:FtsX-like permease family protein [Chloroflexi bacterium TSY]|nr:FtsX-like permease family protein [Chloroflexi bacterium TSY]
MNTFFAKIWHDLWSSPGRTLQVVLIIGVGAFAIGLIVGTRNLTIKSVSQIWQTTSPATIALATAPPIDDAMVDALMRIEGVEDVEGFTVLPIEWRRSPDEPWLPAGLTARDDYTDQRYTKLSLVEGDWPQGKWLGLEQGSDRAFGVALGDRVELRINDNETVASISGVLYNPVGMPPSFGGTAQFYTTRDRLVDLTGSRNFNRILAGIEQSYSEVIALALADEMQGKLEKQGVNVEGATTFLTRTTNPNKHFFQDTLDGVFLVLGILATLALILGLFLVFNTISAIISRQIDQIGIMKALGATTGQILGLYVTTILAYSVLALLLALPTGIWGAWWLTNFLLGFFNVQSIPFALSPAATIAQVGVAVLAPLIASLVPLWGGARMTVREAINTYGLRSNTGWLVNLLAHAERISRLVLLTIGNTFRRRGRVILTQISLVLSGLIFMMVVGVSDAANHTYTDVLASILKSDINLFFAEPERIDRIEALAAQHPDVSVAEAWGLSRGTVRLAQQPESNDDERAMIFGTPLSSTLYTPQMRGGRWLGQDDVHAAVVSQKLAQDAGITIGDQILFEHGQSKSSRWQVVGLHFDPINANAIFVPRQSLLQSLRNIDKAHFIWIQTEPQLSTTVDIEENALEGIIAQELRNAYTTQGIELLPQGIFPGDTTSEITHFALSRVSVIITLLGMMALVIGLVGGIALSGVLSLNVLERRREIGVMRAIGASSFDIARLFIGEGLILGVLSWLIALPLSIPIAQLMTMLLGTTVRSEMVYLFRLTGPVMWLGVIVLLSILASWLPARRAVQISVRESLSYQ